MAYGAHSMLFSGRIQELSSRAHFAPNDDNVRLFCKAPARLRSFQSAFSSYKLYAATRPPSKCQKAKYKSVKKCLFYQLQSAKAQHHASHVVLACGNGLSMVDTVLALKELNCPKPIYSLSTHGFKIFIAQQKPTRRISNYTPCNERKSFVSLLALKRL